MGREGAGKSSATVALPESLGEIGRLRFAYANYSRVTDCIGRVFVRRRGAKQWDKVWEKEFKGLQVNWASKPWPEAEIKLDRADGPFELRFETEGKRGLKFDQLEISE